MKLKAEVKIQLRTRCSGCGTTFRIELLSEPIAFENPEILTGQIMHMTHSLSESSCPTCKEKMQQISFFAEPSMVKVK